jgi:hypothetical protein
VLTGQIKIPEMLNVKEGFHHDLNAHARDELRGPTFPYTMNRK